MYLMSQKIDVMINQARDLGVPVEFVKTVSE